MASSPPPPAAESRFRTILGIRFYAGPMEGLLERIREGGLVVVPGAPVLADMPRDPAQREALRQADFALTDSGLLVLLWRLLAGEALPRISGLKLMHEFVRRPEFGRAGTTFWIMPSAEDAKAYAAWLRSRGVALGPADWCVAPWYAPRGPLSDPDILARIEERRPRFVVIGIGGGVQERLGLYLRDRLSYRPALLCTGGAIALLSGRQVRIPLWADAARLGWLFRVLRNPWQYGPRFLRAVRLVPMVWREAGEKRA